MSLGGGSKVSPAPMPAPTPTIVTPGLEQARADLIEMMRRARSRQESRVTLNALQSPYIKTKASAVLNTNLGDMSVKTPTLAQPGPIGWSLK